MPKKKKKEKKDAASVEGDASADGKGDLAMDESKYLQAEGERMLNEFSAKQFETRPACEVRVDPSGRKGRYLVR